METGQICLYVGLGAAGLIFLLTLLSNLLTAFRYFTTDKGGESASGVAMGAWALTLVAFFCPPCGLIFAIVGLVMARMQRLKAMNGEVSMFSLMPASAAQSNALSYVLLVVVVAVAYAASMFL